jgi:hypothetical protein
MMQKQDQTAQTFLKTHQEFLKLHVVSSIGANSECNQQQK